ncbi:non-canonical purine NTP pyrophosphatase [Microvirga yunnanensis]
MEHAHCTAEGGLATAVRGEGFGYDSTFIPAGEKRIVAEVEAKRRPQSR